MSVLDKKRSINILKTIYKARFIDQKMEKLVRQNYGTSFFLSCQGHEIIGAFFSNFTDKKNTYSFPYYRDRAFVLGMDSSIIDIFAAFLPIPNSKDLLPGMFSTA